jgi:hypothetical protein
MLDYVQIFDFSRSTLPLITLAVFIAGVLTRAAKWISLGFPKLKRPPSKSHRIGGAIKNWSIYMIPPWDLAGRVEPVGYVVGIMMHATCILVLLGAMHEASVTKLLNIPYHPSSMRFPMIPASNLPITIPKDLLTYFITPVFLSTLGVLILRRLYQNIRGGPLKPLTIKSDWIAAPLLWSAGLTGLLAVLAVGPYTQILTLHLIVTQVFIMYLPYSKLLHSATVFAVRTWAGFRRAIYGV